MSGSDFRKFGIYAEGRRVRVHQDLRGYTKYIKSSIYEETYPLLGHTYLITKVFKPSDKYKSFKLSLFGFEMEEDKHGFVKMFSASSFCCPEINKVQWTRYLEHEADNKIIEVLPISVIPQINNDDLLI